MMLAEMINFDCDNFKVDDADVDHEDKILKRELNQLISEQLGDFDLSEEEDQPDEICIVQTKPGCSPPETVAGSSDDLISIIEAGKLSLLESAIQKFGECSENATTESNELTSLGYDGQQSNSNHNALGLSGRCSQDTQVVRQFGNSANESEKSTNCNNIHQVSNSHLCDNVQNPQLPIFPSVVSQDKTIPKVPIAAPIINWDLSLPGEVSDTLFSTAVDNKNQYTTHDHGQVISGPTNSIQTPPSPWSLLPSSVPQSLPPPNFTENVAWSTTSIVPTPSHAAYNEVTQAGIPVETKAHLVVHTATSELTSSNIPCVTSSADMNLDSHLLPSGNRDRRELLYSARGHQLQELQAEVVQLKEEIAKEKRLSNHRILLAEGEKEILRSKLSTLEDTVKSLRMELVTKKENAEVLQNQLQENAECQKKLNEELLALRTTNESLSCQLVELTTGNALKRAEEREAQLAESLEQRFLSRTEEIKTELKATQRNLNEKENEVSDLRRQLEICKAETIKAQQTHSEMIKEANKQLEEAQKHCQQLASSALCSEVTSLRQKVIELETSRKITEDVNKILQDELRGFRDQVAIYENVLRLDVYSHNADNEDPIMYEPSDLTPYANKGRHSGKSVAFADVDTHGPSEANPLHRRPSSAIERPIYHQALDENFDISTRCHSDEQSTRTRQHSGGKQAFSDNEDMLGKLGECDKVSFHSLTRQGILTSTPAVKSKSSPKSPMGRLRAELEKCLLNYKAKREQITKLHEALYTTRCQLHQSRELTEKAEKSAKLLQERVVSMEHELSTLRGIGENPGPREVLLGGQLERLKGDYVRLEEELQVTRTRLQAALGAEAKALEAEKAASERLAASVAERDAAVDRARAVCESHYTAMRRRLEVDWANEKEAYARRAEEKLADMRKELYGMQQEVQRVTNLYHESQVSAKKAVEDALLEAMKLREAERMKFWREELPEQIEVARQSWLSEMKGQYTSVNPSHKSVQTEPSADTSDALQSSVHIQTSLCDLLSIKLGLNLSDNSTFDNTEMLEIKSILLNKYPILSQFMSMECIHYLCTHLIETPCMNLLYLEKEISNSFHTLLEIRLQNFLKQINNELNKLIDEYKVTHIFSENTDRAVLSDNAVILKCFGPLQSISVNGEPDKTTADCIAHNLSVKTTDTQLSNTISSEYQSFMTKVRILTSSVSKSSDCSPSSDLHNSLSTCEHKFVQVSDLEAPYYYSILEKIKGMYVFQLFTC
ncbi:unnamed protein product [Trichobilharzia szidati]|nr:unnamed protein product [Trichobilharzia szidati]